MLHTRAEAIEYEGFHNEAIEEKRNNDFYDFIMKKDISNITINFIELFQRFKNLLWFFTKLIYQFKDIWGKDLFQIILLKFFSTFSQICIKMQMSIQEIVLIDIKACPKPLHSLKTWRVSLTPHVFREWRGFGQAFNSY